MTPTLTLPKVDYDAVKFAGGLDLSTPTLDLAPGKLRDSLNFECAVTGGYSRIAGYERYDGRAKPSAATYTILQLESFTAQPAVGDTLTGQTSGTTGTVIAVNHAEADGEPNYVILTLVVGPGYTSTEVVKVGATLIGTLIPLDLSLTALQNAQFLNLAADVYRAFIGTVPGSGPVRGVFAMLNSGVHEVFAFRNNVGGTSCDLYKATTSGWSQITYLNEVSFTAGGNVVPADGTTLTQGGVTATIRRVCTESGDWVGAPGTAEGRLIITNPAGGNFAAGAATITGGITLTLSGVQTAITMSPGGKFEFDYANFSGQLSTKRIYGCDRVNRGFEFDGVTLAPIRTGLSPDAPLHIRVHQKHLFILFGSSVLHSGIGTPFNWTALAGAAEYAAGDTCHGMIPLPGDQTSPAMLIACRNSFKVMYGSAAGGTDSFRLVSYDSEAGAYEYSLQNLERSYMLDDIGVKNLQAAQEFGNFGTATLTFAIQALIQEKRTLLTYSCVNKDRSQYRLFFSDGSGLYLTIVNGKYLGAMPVKFAHTVNCAFSGELANGNEVTYVGGTNGFVYQFDSGSSFDGEAIEAYIVPNWDMSKSPRLLKQYLRATLEMQGTSYAAIDFSYVLGYGSTEYDRQPAVSYTSNFSGTARWDAATWDAFIWDGQTVGPVRIEMSGTGENVQVRLGMNNDYTYAFTINSLILDYFKRRALR